MRVRGEGVGVWVGEGEQTWSLLAHTLTPSIEGLDEDEEEDDNDDEHEDDDVSSIITKSLDSI